MEGTDLTNNTDKHQDDYNVAVNTVEYPQLAADDRHKLEDPKEGSWNDAEQMKHHPDSVMASEVEIAFPWCRSACLATEDIVEVQVLETRKDEPQQCTGEYEDWKWTESAN